MELITLGEHRGVVRRLARGTRLACRPYVARWGDDFEDPDAALRRSAWALTQTGAPDFVTWVPGHDGSPGPGFHLAEALSAVWRVPVVETLTRHHPVRSAHAANGGRPSIEEVAASMTAISLSGAGAGILVDNVIASGASIAGALSVLATTNIAIVGLASVSIDATAGCGEMVRRRKDGWTFRRLTLKHALAA